jgi:hypothetical protein
MVRTYQRASHAHQASTRALLGSASRGSTPATRHQLCTAVQSASLASSMSSWRSPTVRCAPPTPTRSRRRLQMRPPARIAPTTRRRRRAHPFAQTAAATPASPRTALSTDSLVLSPFAVVPVVPVHTRIGSGRNSARIAPVTPFLSRALRASSIASASQGTLVRMEQSASSAR